MGDAFVPVVVAAVYASIIAAMALILRQRFADVTALRSAGAKYIVLALVGWGVAYAVVWLAHVALNQVLGPWSATSALLGAIGADDGRLAPAGPALRAIILVRACALAPLAEELLFRGVLFTWLRRRLSAPWTVVLTAIGFAVIHGYPALLLLGFAGGVAAGWVRERSASVMPTIVAHVVHNILLVTFSYATTGWTARLPVWPHG
jgi:membrane protease YdiL (CAAX protease family)